jgi:hypothetical protein
MTINNVVQLSTAFQAVAHLNDDIVLENLVVLEGIQDFAEYVATEVEFQDQVNFDEVSVEDFNKLVVNLFDSGLVVSILEASVEDDSLSLDFSIIDTWYESNEDDVVSVEVSVDLNLKTGDLVLSSLFMSDKQDQLDESVLIGGVLSILGIRDEEVNLVVPQDEEEISDCALVIKERLTYLVGEALIQFGTRWRKMVDPVTFETEEDAVEVVMPEFPGETSVLLFGMFLVSESSRINELLMGDDDLEEDEDTESGFGFIKPNADERPIEERLREALSQVASNKTLH